jgi:hypothetical protein
MQNLESTVGSVTGRSVSSDTTERTRGGLRSRTDPEVLVQEILHVARSEVRARSEEMERNVQSAYETKLVALELRHQQQLEEVCFANALDLSECYDARSGLKPCML